MPSIKIYPPSRLPDSNVNETQFHMWQEELEVYLSQEDDYEIFLPGKSYANWLSYEEDVNRLPELKQEDTVIPNDDAREGRIITAAQATVANSDRLDNIRINLRTVLSIIGKCVSTGHYNSVIKHSTSLAWIYNMLRADYDIQNKGVHFFHILEAKYDATKYTPVAFYNFYRTIVANNLAKNGDILKYKNNERLEQDEKFTPMLEDIVLLDAIKEIDSRLPTLVKNFYFHKIKKEERLMDFKTDILLNIPHFLEQLNIKEEDATLNAFKHMQVKKKMTFSQRKNDGFQRKYCRMCFLSKRASGVYYSHNFGDSKCPSLSDRDRKTFLETAKLAIVKQESDEDDVDQEEVAEMYGYNNLEETSHNDPESSQVLLKNNSDKPQDHNFRNEETCGYIQPCASQILTVFTNPDNTVPFHIELDSGATISYIREYEARKHNLDILPNSQVSKLGDGLTKFEAIGEVNVYFFRKLCKLKFHAIVCKNLSSAAIGGVNFMKENNIHQDLIRNVIHLSDKSTVLPTNSTAIMETEAIIEKDT